MQDWTVISLYSHAARVPSISSQQHHPQKIQGNDPPHVNQEIRQIRVTREENQENRWERKNNLMGEEKQEKRKKHYGN